MGVGWWQYQRDPTFITKHFYKSILNKKILHSVRDSYTARKLENVGITNVLNTSCPTTWSLDGLDTNRKNLNCRNCLFTLTDYSWNLTADTKWIEIILNHYSGDIYFFPQGFHDEEYLNTLEIFHIHKNRIKILEHSIEALYECLKMADINYIGTRLHSGTMCLQHNIDSVIIAIDNRATEIAKDIRLPVVERTQPEALVKWLEGVQIF
ncbi:MAG: polysaccharide pyruvyl transferase family protein [Thioploca sp.]|nr:polysaccharide pyruvyl transferase family protein [Thioploca sp.]